jgi:hypothetical protein
MSGWDVIEQAFDAAWNENAHPRKGGQFTSKGEGGGGGTSKPKKHLLRRTGKVLGHAALGGLFGAGYGAYQGWKQPLKRDQRETEFLAKLARRKHGKGEDALHRRGNAANHNPVRHHGGGRNPKGKDAGPAAHHGGVHWPPLNAASRVTGRQGGAQRPSGSQRARTVATGNALRSRLGLK